MTYTIYKVDCTWNIQKQQQQNLMLNIEMSPKLNSLKE